MSGIRAQLIHPEPIVLIHVNSYEHKLTKPEAVELATQLDCLLNTVSRKDLELGIEYDGQVKEATAKSCVALREEAIETSKAFTSREKNLRETNENQARELTGALKTILSLQAQLRTSSEFGHQCQRDIGKLQDEVNILTRTVERLDNEKLRLMNYIDEVVGPLGLAKELLKGWDERAAMYDAEESEQSA